MKGAKLKLARAMRRAPSSTEAVLWRLLRGRQLAGLKFRRQVPMGPYVADFVCLAHRLIVEADGPFHDPVEDAARDTWLKANGFLVLRFENARIHTDRNAIFAEICDAAERRPFQPPLLF